MSVADSLTVFSNTSMGVMLWIHCKSPQQPYQIPHRPCLHSADVMKFQFRTCNTYTLAAVEAPRRISLLAWTQFRDWHWCSSFIPENPDKIQIVLSTEGSTVIDLAPTDKREFAITSGSHRGSDGQRTKSLVYWPVNLEPQSRGNYFFRLLCRSHCGLE